MQQLVLLFLCFSFGVLALDEAENPGANDSQNEIKNVGNTGTKTANAKLTVKDTKIVIIGAGAAGLTAAQKLLDKKFDVMILEARDKIGGRIESKLVTKGWVDYGASVVIEAGTLPSALRELDFVRWPPQQQLVYVSDERGQISDAEQQKAEELEGIFNQLVEKFTNISSEEGREISAGAFMEGYYHDLVSGEKTAAFQELLKGESSTKFVEALYDFIVRVYRNQIAADSLHDVAIKTYQAQHWDTSIISLLNVPFEKYIETIASKIPKENILLNKEVTEIKFDADNTATDGMPIEVSTADGEKYQAHHVIFTASLGVLKETHEKLFQPNLEEKVQKALALMEFGIGEKVFLEYDEPFWKDLKENVTNICFLWEKDQKVDKERRNLKAPWYRSVEAANLCDSADNILELLVSGKAAEAVVQLSEQELKDDVTTFFRKMLKKDDIPTPARAFTTSWSSNKFFRGSKSFISYKSEKADNKILEVFAPTWKYFQSGYSVPGLLFAGEATHPQLFSTVQGAVESAEREADRLIQTLITDKEELSKLIAKMKMGGMGGRGFGGDMNVKMMQKMAKLKKARARLESEPVAHKYTEEAQKHMDEKHAEM